MLLAIYQQGRNIGQDGPKFYFGFNQTWIKLNQTLISL